MRACLPLHALLSQALVAFTIEFDNEAEHRMPHCTTNHGASAGPLPKPWLVSMVMWINCLHYVDDEGISARELEHLARTTTNLHGMQRWGYILVEPEHSEGRRQSRLNWKIRLKPGGKKAKEVWRPLFDVIDKRWQERFGTNEIDSLRQSLTSLTGHIDPQLPDCLPILGYGLYCRQQDTKRKAAAPPKCEPSFNALPLPSLFSKLLLSFAIEFELQSKVSLAICANVLRLFSGESDSDAGPESLRVKDLPRLSGVSKEAIAVALSFLGKQGYALVRAESSASRTKVVHLTPKGRQARDNYHQIVESIEKLWRSRYDKDQINRLRESLEQIVEPAKKSRLFRGMQPYPENWRAAIPAPEVLPYFPMVLHRGGYPDGS